MGFRNYIECGRTDNIGTSTSKIHLGIDASAYIYAALEKILPGRVEKNMSLNDFKRAFFTAFIEEIMQLIKHFTPARIDQVYIAFDGVPSVAKIIEQRRRRASSADSYKVRHGTDLIFDSRWLVPMLGILSQSTGSLINELIEHLSASSPVKWWVSSTFLPGEGEHKLVKVLSNINAPVVICGNDNDVAVLLAFSATPERPRYVHNSTGTYHVNTVLRRVGVRSDLNAIINFTIATCFLGNDFVVAPYPFVGIGRDVRSIMALVLAELGNKICIRDGKLTHDFVDVIVGINNKCRAEYPQFLNRTGHRLATEQAMQQERVPQNKMRKFFIACAIEWLLMVESIVALYKNVGHDQVIERTIAGYYTRSVNIPVDYLQAGILILLDMRDKNTKPAEKELYLNMMREFASPFFQRLVPNEQVVTDDLRALNGPVLTHYHTLGAHFSLAVPFAAGNPKHRDLIKTNLEKHIKGYGNHTTYLEKILFTETHECGVNYFSPLHWKIFPTTEQENTNAPVTGEAVVEQTNSGGQRVLSDQLEPR